MEIRTLKADLNLMDEKEYESTMRKAGNIIKNGGIVAFPTETVYGLGADAFNEEAVKKIFIAKGRPSDNPLIIHVADMDLEKVCKNIPQKAYELMKRFWPGPLTIILEKTAEVPYVTTASLDTVGIRMPETQCARDFIKASGGYIAAPSANISGRPSPTSYETCIRDLDGKCDMIIGKDNSRVGLESTIIDMTTEVPVLLRPGAITVEMLNEVLGEIRYRTKVSSQDEIPKAPGMKYRHYSPDADVTIVKGDRKSLRKFFENTEKDKDVLYIYIDPDCIRKESNLIIFRDIEEASSRIFETFRWADDKGYKKIMLSGTSEKGLGLAFMNRVMKAAGGKELELK